MSLNLSPHAPIDSSDVVLPAVVETHPWRRYLARRIDYWIFALVVGFLLGITGRMPENESRGADLLFELALVVSWIPCEAAFLAYGGATPGKWIFGIKVRAADGSLLKYWPAMVRSMWVASTGMGFGIPLLSLIGAWRGWRSLADFGATGWDEPEGHVVSHHGFQWWHLGVTLFLLLLVAALMYFNGLLLIPFLDSLRPEGPGASDEG